MKKFRFIVSMLLIAATCPAQIKWSTDSTPSSHLSWNNYSTAYIGDADNFNKPFIMTAIPYNGIYSNTGDIDIPLSLTFDGSLFSYQATLSDKSRRMYTYDSSEVYFLTSGVFENDADKFEYRVTLNAKTIITPWSAITKFSDFQLSPLKKKCGYLGGYKTSWGNFIAVELRKKGADTSLSAAIVYWKEIKPVLQSVYTSKSMNDFFILLKRPWDKALKTPGVPKEMKFFSGENSLIFYFSADIFKKEALEYQILKDGKAYLPWIHNDYDNNFIKLGEMKPGSYDLQARYSKQRHNVSSSHFEILPQWQQTAAFKIAVTILLTALAGFLFLLFRVQQQRRKLSREQFNNEKKQVQLKAIRSQLNPHFTFNALSSIQGLINKNEPGKANDYLSEFSALLRETLKSNDKELIPLQFEIKMLENYIRLEQLRFNFTYTLDTDKNLQPNNIEIPSLIVQPLVENAVKHGIASLQEHGKLRVSFSKSGSTLLITITDNGKGFDKSDATNGFGLKLTKERIELLNQSFKYKAIEFSIESDAERGTTSSLIFQNWV